MERSINPLFNIHERYKEMHIINPYRFNQLRRDLVSCWELDETSGSTVYDSYGGINGSLSNVAINQSGKINKAYLSNVSSIITIPKTSVGSYFNSGNIFTFSLWAYRTKNWTGSRFLLVKPYISYASPYYQFMIKIEPTTYDVGIALFDTRGSYIRGSSSAFVLNINTWYNIVATFRAIQNDWKLVVWVNGVNILNSSSSNTYTYRNYNTDLNFVGLSTSAAMGFVGLVDQYSLWNRELTPAEVSILYNSGNGLAYSQW